jgi:hypothetical protein
MEQKEEAKLPEHFDDNKIEQQNNLLQPFSNWHI